jgi:hypothetical protein
MRQFLAMGFLGAILAFGAGPALAEQGDPKVDYVPPYQRTQSVPVVSRTVIRTGLVESVVAGGGITATFAYRHLRDENMEGGKAGR